MHVKVHEKIGLVTKRELPDVNVVRSSQIGARLKRSDIGAGKDGELRRKEQTRWGDGTWENSLKIVSFKKKKEI
jgi:hypothetical protein